MITPMRFLAVLAVFTLLTASCAPTLNLSLGQIPAADPGKLIKSGQTSRQEILKIFGPPDLEGVDEKGLPTWTYTRLTVEVVKARDAAIKEFFNLEVSFKGDVVDSFSYDVKAREVR